MDLYGSFSTPSDCLHIDDFLDFSNITTTTTDTHHHFPPPQNSPSISHDPNFFLNFPSVPSDEAVELEWLSQFVNDEATSFHNIPPPASIGSHTTPFLSNNNRNNEYPKSSSSSPVLAGKSRARSEGSVTGDGVRRCSHCATDKTPQWRTGPLGPKTLCNACGVRFKSGRLVPEYRPAASPTFVMTQHSNSHRKVMELRRQKELLRHQQQEQCYRHTHHDFKVC
ncbi:GATA transcription factor 2 [Glycine soja]